MDDMINRQDAIEAVEQAIYNHDSAIMRITSLPSAEDIKVAYICDGRKCDSDCSECFRTTDIEHAKNFIRLCGVYMEQAEAEQIASKLRNPCDSLLTDDSAECKEKKSKLDLISRQDAIRKCCGEKCGCEREECGYTEACSEVMRLESLPSASVEVVRCGECMHKYMKDFDMFCPHMVGIIKPNMHCSYGEREGE